MSVLDLVAKLKLDSSSYDTGLTEAESKASGFGNAIGGILGGTAMALGTAVVTATTAVAAETYKFTKMATDAYGEYEQLAGGIETLFGEAAPKVMEDASRAFNDAGMSINQYMETSIQSAAAMINSLEGDQAKAAELMNVSIIDMADNVNKMGTTMESVQNAYRGFSRGNFTMLDNLALGFSGTKEGMQQLLDKAQEISGIEYDIGSYSDIVQAIHVVQEEMGISGTTMKEAGETITGSLSAVQAAWQNLIIGIGNENADIGALMDNLLNSLFGKDGEGGFISNILPRVETILSRLPEFITTALSKIPNVLQNVVPGVVQSIFEMFSTVLQFYAENSSNIVDSIMTIATMVIGYLMDFIQEYVAMMPAFMEIGMAMMQQLGEGLADALPELIPAIVEVFMMMYKTCIANLDVILDVAFKIIIALVEGMMNALPDVVFGITEIILEMVAQIIKCLPVIIEAGINLIMVLIEAIVTNGIAIVDGEYFFKLLQVLIDVWKKIDWLEIGKNIIQGIIDGIKNGWENLKDAVTGTADRVKGAFTDAFGIHSPSKVFKYYGEMMTEGLAEGLEDDNAPLLATQTLADQIDNAMNLTPKLNIPVSGMGGMQLAGAGAGIGGDIIIPVSIGNELLDTIVVKAIDRANYKSGGR